MILLKESKKVIKESDEANKAIPEGIIPISEAAKRPAFKKWNINAYKKEGYEFFCTFDYAYEHDGKDLYIMSMDADTAYICKKAADIKKFKDFDKTFGKIESLVRSFDRDFNAKIAMPLEKLFGDNMPESISEPLYSIWNNKLDDLKKAMDTYEFEIPDSYPKVKVVHDDDLTGYNPD